MLEIPSFCVGGVGGGVGGGVVEGEEIDVSLMKEKHFVLFD